MSAPPPPQKAGMVPPAPPIMAEATVVHAVAVGGYDQPPPSPAGMGNHVGSPAPPLAHNPSQQHVNNFNEGGCREFLSSNQNNWPRGLQDTFIKNIQKVPIRYFIVDDSGSMAASDGHRLYSMNFNEQKLISCSRWAELGESVKFHMQVSLAANAPSEFRLLNGAPPILLGGGDPNELNGHQLLCQRFDESPNGGTPLCRHIREIIEKVRSLETFLRQSGQLAAIIIMTDGQSSDGNLAEAMKPLKHLPVHVVVRLCTDDDNVVDYWNNVDSELELQMDVLDDLSGEAKEVTEKNKWLTYGEPLHRLREFGVTVKEFDLMDEIQLSKDQMSRVCRDIYGGDMHKFPPPEADWNAFVKAIEEENATAPSTWCPIHKKNMPWVTKRGLNDTFNEGGCVIS